jgi:hypothetical protein
MSLGDNFSGYSIVGVDSSYFRWFGFSIVQGQWPLSAEDAIISKELADQLQIQLGDQIHSSHGSSQGEEHNHHPLRVSGIFDAERYIDRQTIFVQNEAFLEMHHSENVSYTSLLLKLKSKSALLMLPRVIDARNDEQGAFPVFIFGQLEKQWTPILNRISNWSILFVIVLMLIHWAYILSVFRYERIGVELMHIKKQSALRSGTAFFGAYILTVIVGILCFFALANALPFIKYSGIELSLLILLVFIELVSAVYLSKIIHND